MNVTDKIIDDLTKRIADQIDQEVIENITLEILIEDGWTQTNINPAFSEYGMMKKPFEDWYSKTSEWINTYAQGEYKLIKGQWLFNDPRDATMFILRWS
jgi:hypothetical protein